MIDMILIDNVINGNLLPAKFFMQLLGLAEERSEDVRNVILATLVDSDEIGRLYSKDRHLLFEGIRQSLEAQLEGLSHKDLLTLNRVRNGEVQEALQPKANAKYAKALLAFITNKEMDGLSFDSLLTPLITKAVEDEFIAFYADAGRVGEVLFSMEKRLSEIQNDLNLKESLYNNLDMQKVLEKRGGSGQVGGAVKSAMDQFTAESFALVMKQVLSLLKKASYKAVIANIGKAVFSSGIVSFIKPIILAVLAKVGIAAIAKATVAKALSVIIGVGAVTVSIPAAYVLLPVILAFLSYEAYTLPKKLGARLPKEITAKLEADFEAINTAVAAELAESLLQELDKWIVD